MSFKNQFAVLKVIHSMVKEWLLGIWGLLNTKKKKRVNTVFASLLNADYRGIGCRSLWA